MSEVQIAAALGRLEVGQEAIRSDVVEIKAHVKATNGRVTALEREQIARDAAAQALAAASDRRWSRLEWGPSALVAVLLFGAGALLHVVA